MSSTHLKPPSGLLAEKQSVLLVIDIQPKLSGAMPAPLVQQMLKQTRLLARAARILNVPVIATQQYPKGLGPIATEIVDALPETCPIIEKTCFSCQMSEPIISAIEKTGRKQILLTGIEAHVCVLQTAFDLVQHGFDVHVAEDAVCSRTEANLRNAVARMRDAGISVSNTESAVFE